MDPLVKKSVEIEVIVRIHTDKDARNPCTSETNSVQVTTLLEQEDLSHKDSKILNRLRQEMVRG